MCGRLQIHDKTSIYDLVRMYSDDSIEHFDARYNVSPGALLPALYHDQRSHALAMHWGLVPLWAKPGTFKRPLINARAETVFEKPSFRNLVKKHRCAVPVNGFYEWQRTEQGKQPFYFLAPDDQPLIIAGIFQFNKQGEAQNCLVTTAANSVMRPIHDRMPVLLQAEDVEEWLASDDRTRLEALMQTGDDTPLRCYPVSTWVNRASNDGAKCIEAVAEG